MDGPPTATRCCSKAVFRGPKALGRDKILLSPVFPSRFMNRNGLYSERKQNKIQIKKRRFSPSAAHIADKICMLKRSLFPKEYCYYAPKAAFPERGLGETCPFPLEKAVSPRIIPQPRKERQQTPSTPRGSMKGPQPLHQSTRRRRRVRRRGAGFSPLPLSFSGLVVKKGKLLDNVSL